MKIYSKFDQVLTLKSAAQKDGRNLLPFDLDILSNATVVVDENTIKWVGKNEDLPTEYQSNSSAQIIDGVGKCLTPELVDSHTHLVFGGDRADEYAMRLNGADYQEIAKAGGGILSSMKATREASEDELFEIGIERVNNLVNHGIKTIEIKSGYGLDFENEYKLSKVIDRLQKEFAPKSIQIFRTYLAAHAVPKDFSSSNQYIKEVVLPLLDKVAEENLVDFVDIFHEEGYFDLNDTKELFSYAQKLNLKLKIHADEFQDNGGAEVAMEFKATSCDHLLRTNTNTAAKFADSSTVATILPGTSMFLGKDFANVQSFLKTGAIVSFASDYNPGSCHAFNLLQLISTAAPTLGINQTQLWAGITLNASKALGLDNQGAIIEGFVPRFSIFNTDKVSKITYHWGKNFAINQ
jgi:imidazolonepropionase